MVCSVSAMYSENSRVMVKSKVYSGHRATPYFSFLPPAPLSDEDEEGGGGGRPFSDGVGEQSGSEGGSGKTIIEVARRRRRLRTADGGKSR